METPQDDRPDYIKLNEVGTGVVEFGGSQIPYAILKKSVESRLPGFVGYPGGKHLFISEEVPAPFRELQLIHEIIEFTELRGVPGRCRQALIRELALVPAEIRDAYVAYRRDFFAGLVEYYETSPDEDFKGEIRASLEHLRSV